MKKLLTVCLILSALSVSAQNSVVMVADTSLTASARAQSTAPSQDTLAETAPVPSEKIGVKEVKWPALDTLLHSGTDTTYVINFWATWCRPCVAELPHFEELNRNYASQKVRVLLVSMDFVKDIEDRVIPFVERMKLANTVWLLNEPDANSFIEKVDTSWSGALPATLILNPARAKRAFFEKALDYETLVRELSYFIEY